MQPRRPMSPGGQKSDLHQPKAKNQPQGQVIRVLHQDCYSQPIYYSLRHFYMANLIMRTYLQAIPLHYSLMTIAQTAHRQHNSYYMASVQFPKAL